MTVISWLLPLAGGYCALVLLVYVLQGKLVFMPSRTLVATPAEVGLEYEDFEAETVDGLRIHGWLVPPRSGNVGNPEYWALFCHGNAGNISHRLDTLRMLHELGLGVCIFDYRGYGKSQGSPSEKGLYRDVAAVWEHLLDRGVQPGQVIAWGRSLGGAVAAWLAAERDPGALVIESSFTSVVDMGRRSYPFLPVSLLCRNRLDAKRHAMAAGRKGCPVLVIHSADDEIVPYAMGREIYTAIPGPKRFLELRGGHNDGFLLSAGLYMREVRRFLLEMDSISKADSR